MTSSMPSGTSAAPAPGKPSTTATANAIRHAQPPITIAKALRELIGRFPSSRCWRLPSSSNGFGTIAGIGTAIWPPDGVIAQPHSLSTVLERPYYRGVEAAADTMLRRGRLINLLLNERHVLRLRLLGPARIEAGDPGEPVELVAHKGAALAYYLAARPEQPVTRTRLISLLWQDSDEQEGRNSLSTALSRLRRTLRHVPIAPVGLTANQPRPYLKIAVTATINRFTQ